MHLLNRGDSRQYIVLNASAGVALIDSGLNLKSFPF